MERKKQPVGTERLASAWLGAAGIQTEAPCSQAVQLDMSANAALAKFTGGLSPAALSNAYVDWLLHFQLAPAEQAGLLQKAWKNLWRWSQYAIAASATVPAGAGHCIEPLPQDRRFADPAWERWPFNLIAQGFLLNQQWWHRATTGIPGVSRHHEDVVTFTARQILDMLAPSNFISTNPVVQEDALRSNGLSLVRGTQLAMADLLQLTTGHTEDETFKVGENMAVTPGKVVYHNHLIELIQYTPSTAQVHAIPLLFVPAWIMKYYILDLSPQNSLVKYLVDNGYTVFMISWKNPLTEDRDLSMEDYRKLGVMAAIDAVTSITGATQVNGVGYCLGGTLLAIAAASMARDGDQRLASLSLFAAQTDFTEPGELSLFIDEAQIGFLEAAMWEHGYLDGKQMAGAFQLLRSNDLIWSHRLNQYLRGVAENKSDLMTWNADATRMPYRMHSEYLRQLFLHNDLAEGRYRTDGKPIALTDLHIPLFAVGTLTDHVAPWRSVFKIHLLTETEVTFLLTSGGHNAGVVSPPGHPHRSYQIATRAKDGPFLDVDTWQRDATRQEGSWWPAWEAWLAARSGKEIGPPAMPPSRRKAPGLYVLQP